MSFCKRNKYLVIMINFLAILQVRKPTTTQSSWDLSKVTEQVSVIVGT